MRIISRYVEDVSEMCLLIITKRRSTTNWIGQQEPR